MNLLKSIQNILPTRSYIDQVVRENKQVLFQMRAELLWERVYTATESGISTERLCEHEVVVSLTTFGKRLYEVALTIESIMHGSVRPNRIILWLDDTLEGKKLPLSLLHQQQRGLEIRYCRDIRSYKKLIPALQAFPEAVIVTVDDDVIYQRDLLESLLDSYRSYPEAIHAGRIHRITFRPSGQPDLYLRWQWQCTSMKPSHLHFYTGVGGVLYPPHCLDEEVTNEEVFMRLSPTADDMWFKAMALRKGTPVKKIRTHHAGGCDYLENMAVQDVGLCTTNYNRAKSRSVAPNDVQLRAVLDAYNLQEMLHD